MTGTKPYHYPDSFFDSIDEGSLRSANVVLPILLRVVQPASVVDVGCGRGAWLRGFQELGVARVAGIDGDYVNSARCYIEPRDFVATDLSKPFEVRGEYDLALCLEVAEHLPAAIGPYLVRELTKVAPYVLFSAAIPGQGGVNHINERWPSYWRTLFAEHGFVMLDPIRRHVRDNPEVELWYRQNMVLYVSEAVVRESPLLRAERALVAANRVEWVPASMLAPYGSVRGVCSLLPALIHSALRRTCAAWLSSSQPNVAFDASDNAGERVNRCGAEARPL